MPNCPLTSDTLGQLTVTGIAPTSNVVAIIFAPGGALDPQLRDAAANINNAANYLDDENQNGNNSTFTTAPVSTTFNDRLLVITNADLMPVVERRVAREMRSLLQSYIAATGAYPWADSIGLGSSILGSNRGRFPCGTALPVIWGSLVAPLTPALPNWLTNGCGSNGWASVIYYTAAQNRLEPVPCTSCTGISLSVDGVSGTDLVLLTPGAASISPRGAWPTAYFEDSQNNDNADDSYVTPTSTAYNRDRLFKLP